MGMGKPTVNSISVLQVQVWCDLLTPMATPYLLLQCHEYVQVFLLCLYIKHTYKHIVLSLHLLSVTVSVALTQLDMGQLFSGLGISR
jgi:hypothetical protein